MLHVLSNDPKKPSVPLAIKANVENMVIASPESLKLSLKKPNAGCPEISLKSKDGRAFSIKRITSNPKCITINYDPNETKKEFILKPQVNMIKLEKALKGFITIDVNHPESKSLKIDFSAPPVYSVKPAIMYFFASEPGKAQIKENVWVINNYQEKFKITSITSQKNTLEVLENEARGEERYKLKLQVTPPPKPKDTNQFRDDLIIKTDTGAEIKVQCSIFYKVERRSL